MASKKKAKWRITFIRAGKEETLICKFDRAEPPTENDAAWEVLKVIGTSFFTLPPRLRNAKYTLTEELAARGAVITSCVEIHTP